MYRLTSVPLPFLFAIFLLILTTATYVPYSVTSLGLIGDGFKHIEAPDLNNIPCSASISSSRTFVFPNHTEPSQRADVLAFLLIASKTKNFGKRNWEKKLACASLVAVCGATCASAVAEGW